MFDAEAIMKLPNDPQSAISGEWMYVFKPTVTGTRLYVKLILRGDCIIISFHEEGIDDGN